MTDFTHAIQTTAEQIEDLEKDLEAHLEDILDVDVDVVESDVEPSDGWGDRMSIKFDSDDLAERLEDRLDADEVWVRDMRMTITPTIPEEDAE